MNLKSITYRLYIVCYLSRLLKRKFSWHYHLWKSLSRCINTKKLLKTQNQLNFTNLEKKLSNSIPHHSSKPSNPSATSISTSKNRTNSSSSSEINSKPFSDKISSTKSRNEEQNSHKFLSTKKKNSSQSHKLKRKVYVSPVLKIYHLPLLSLQISIAQRCLRIFLVLISWLYRTFRQILMNFSSTINLSTQVQVKW